MKGVQRPPSHIPLYLQTFVDHRIEHYADAHDWAESQRRQWRFDRVRFAKTLQWLDVVEPEGRRVLELGAHSIASSILREHARAESWLNTDFDLRDPFPLPDQSFDLVVSTEVIEHIGDRTFFAETTFEGVRQVLAECRRILRPGGQMLMTTPNAHSTWVIQRALLRQPPLLHDHHYREYTVEEIRAFVAEAGFELLLTATEQVWHHWDFAPIERFMAGNGYSLEDRGDDTFILAERPGR